MSSLSCRLRRYAIVAVLFVPVVAGAFVWQHPALLTAAGLFEQVIQTLATQYVDTLPMDSLYVRAAHGLVSELHDPYTELFTPAKVEENRRSDRGNFVGIGVYNVTDPRGVYISRVIPGTPAELGGLHIGDLIIQIDTLQFRPGLTGQEVGGHLRGPAGTSVHLTVVREKLNSSHHDTLRLTLIRKPVHVAVVPFTLLLDGHVGYLPLREFDEGTADEVHAALDSLRRAGATIILDLRDNGGGFEDEAVALCGLFLSPGQVVIRARRRDGEHVKATSSTPPVAPSEPLVVLVNHNTGSAAEVTAGALQDHDRAAVVGQPTYGKGIGQEILPMPDGYALKLTAQHWYTPLGHSVHRERKMLPNGEYVEVHPESLQTASERRARPTYKSDGGRTLYGDAGISPDLVVRDTMEAGRMLFFTALKSNVWRMQSILSSYAASLAQTTPHQIHVTPAMRAAFLRYLRVAGITVSRSMMTSKGAFLDRLIAERIAIIRGDAPAAKRMGLGNDVSLSQALTVLKQAENQASLFTVVQKQESSRR